MEGIIEAVWQSTQAAQWQEAYTLLEQEEVLGKLSLWGGNILFLDLCQWFLPQPEWQPKPEQTSIIYSYLGSASATLGERQQALQYFQQALSIREEVGDREGKV